MKNFHDPPTHPIANMRKQFGVHFWWVSLFSVFLGQTAFLFIPSLSLYGALHGNEPLNVMDWVAFCIAVSAILLETLADMQMDTFQHARLEKRTEAIMIDRGLWLLCRHPN